MLEEVFHFKHFSVDDSKCAMKVGTDGVLLGAWVQPKDAKLILDVGTGSGLIALMLAQKSDAIIDAIDLDNDAVEQASVNFKRSNWSDRIKNHHAAYQGYEQNGKHYDLIVSNPPFYSDSSSPKNQARNIARHSDTSLSHEDLLKNTYRLLNENGRFCIILPAKESIEVLKLAPVYGLFCSHKTTIRTKANKEPKRIMMEFKKMLTETKNDELAILNGDENYSKAFKHLTKDYYMQLTNP